MCFNNRKEVVTMKKILNTIVTIVIAIMTVFSLWVIISTVDVAVHNLTDHEYHEYNFYTLYFHTIENIADSEVVEDNNVRYITAEYYDENGVIDTTGNVWNIDGVDKGERVMLVFNTLGTEDVTDDVIIDVINLN
jgi:hypothetical protein